MMGRATARPK
jgi:hypothetical protein